MSILCGVYQGRYVAKTLGSHHLTSPKKKERSRARAAAPSPVFLPERLAVGVQHGNYGADHEPAEVPLGEEADEEAIEVPAAHVRVDVECDRAMLELFGDVPAVDLTRRPVESLDELRLQREPRERGGARLETFDVCKVEPKRFRLGVAPVVRVELCFELRELAAPVQPPHRFVEANVLLVVLPLLGVEGLEIGDEPRGLHVLFCSPHTSYRVGLGVWQNERKRHVDVGLLRATFDQYRIETIGEVERNPANGDHALDGCAHLGDRIARWRQKPAVEKAIERLLFDTPSLIRNDPVVGKIEPSQRT